MRSSGYVEGPIGFEFYDTYCTPVYPGQLVDPTRYRPVGTFRFVYNPDGTVREILWLDSGKNKIEVAQAGK